jgi:hypothetical protein
MTILQYPHQGYFTMINGSSTILGNYDLAADGDIELAHLRVYNKNSNQFSYQMRLVISQDEDKEIVAASDWETFSNEIIGQTSSDWLGDLTFTFDNYRLRQSIVYTIKLEIQNYSRSGDSRYMGVWLDWAYPIGTSNTGGARIALGVRR